MRSYSKTISPHCACQHRRPWKAAASGYDDCEGSFNALHQYLPGPIGIQHNSHVASVSASFRTLILPDTILVDLPMATLDVHVRISLDRLQSRAMLLNVSIRATL